MRRRLAPTLIALISMSLLLVSRHGGAPARAQQDVAVRITADNAYGFGYGTIDAMASYFGGIENRVARDIFSCNPDYGIEAYTVPAAAVDDFLYLVAWSDKAVTQGAIAELTAGGQTIYTGIGDWQVYATGQDFRPPSPGPGPSLSEINGHILRANAAAGDPATTSVGWVSATGGRYGNPDALDYGDVNDGSGNFPALTCLDSRARWMWYNSDTTRYPNAFRGGPSPGGHKEFLIFRLPVRALIPTPVSEPTPELPTCVCERVRRHAPAAVVDHALANPEQYQGWGRRLDPGKPAGPMNPLRECLNLRHPNLPFHPLWNSVVWKVGCR